MNYYANGVKLTEQAYDMVNANKKFYGIESTFVGTDDEQGRKRTLVNPTIAERLKYLLIINNYGEHILEMETKNDENEDIINHPKHYNAGEIEVIDYIKDVLTHANHLNAWEGYLLGNSLKYKSHRLGRKATIKEDLQKSMFYDKKLLDYQEEKK